MTTPAQPDQGSGQAGDPSMEDILASIRRILSEEEAGPAPTAEPEPPPAAAKTTPPVADDVLVLDTSMMVAEPDHPQPHAAPAEPAAPPRPEPAPEPAPTSDTTLLAPEAAQAAAGSVNELVRRLSVERQTQVHAGGPTIEDLVRAELRPLIKGWLDEYLPPLVERLVRSEIERVIGRAAP